MKDRNIKLKLHDRRVSALILGALTFLPANLAAFNQPPTNFSATTFLDGGSVPPGTYLVEYPIFTDGSSAKDKNGNSIPGGGRVSALALLSQLFYLSPWRFAGGYLGFDILQPYAAISTQGTLNGAALTANGAGPGDFLAGPVLQWNDSALFGRPFHHRFEIDVTFPTGKYDARFGANPGSNLWTVEPYYAFTWLLNDQWESSCRVFYGIHSENPAVQVQPGQLLHVNASVSRAVLPKFRLGTTGYFLQQTTDDKVSGTPIAGTEERAFALGPGLAYISNGVIMMFSVPVEFGVANRFSGYRSTLEIIHRF